LKKSAPPIEPAKSREARRAALLHFRMQRRICCRASLAFVPTLHATQVARVATEASSIWPLLRTGPDATPEALGILVASRGGRLAYLTSGDMPRDRRPAAGSVCC